MVAVTFNKLTYLVKISYRYRSISAIFFQNIVSISYRVGKINIDPALYQEPSNSILHLVEKTANKVLMH